MANNLDQDRIKALLTEAITVLCKNGLGYKTEFCIDGLLGITIDKDDVFLVKIQETISRIPKRCITEEEETIKKAYENDNYGENRNRHFPRRPSSNLSSGSAQPGRSSPGRGTTNQNLCDIEIETETETEPVSQSLELTRKRSLEEAPSQIQNTRKKRVRNRDVGEPIVIKEEVLDEDCEIQEHNSVFPSESVRATNSSMLSRQDTSLSTGARWPDGLTNESSSSSASNILPEFDSSVKTERTESSSRSNEEPLDFTLNEDQRTEHQLRFNASAVEAAQLALLQQQQQQQVSFLQQAAAANLSAVGPSASVVWQHMNPDYLRMQHKMARPYVCEECGKTFTSSCGRRRHMDTHRGIYPYRCEHCGKGFTASNNLKAHVTLHTNVNNFRCEICGESFRYSQYLKDHVRKDHLDVRLDGLPHLNPNLI